MNKALHSRCLSVVAAIFVVAIILHAQDRKTASKLTVDGNTAMRFNFQRPNANYVLPALIFRVAEVGTSNWDTAPIDRYGRSAYISVAEMRSLVHGLDKNRIFPQLSSTIEPIEPFEKTSISENVVVTIYASDGTATASIRPKEICESLARFNDLIEGRRAHWEFEYFRLGCGCKVPGHKYDAYPNDR
jgi:hypothetical protein